MRGGLGTSSDIPASSSASAENSSFRLSGSNSRRGSFATIHSSPSYSSLQIVKNVSVSNLQAIMEATPTIRPIEIEEAVAKDISAHGFVLRYFYYYYYTKVLNHLFIRLSSLLLCFSPSLFLFSDTFVPMACLVPDVLGCMDVKGVLSQTRRSYK